MQNSIERLSLAVCFLVAAAWGSFGTRSAHAERIEFAYDRVGRLVSATYSPQARIDYGYDANGNLLSRETTAEGTVYYTLIYRAGAGGWIDGVATQTVAAGQSGMAVEAVADDSSVVFGGWSDGRPDNPRTDVNVQANLWVQTDFRSQAGASLDWYARHGFTPQPGEWWSDLDSLPIPAKDSTLWSEFVADTNPNSIDDVFLITGVESGPPMRVYFQPGSTGRIYRFEYTDNLSDGVWSNVPGTGPRFGAGGEDHAEDIDPAIGRAYRVRVQAP